MTQRINTVDDARIAVKSLSQVTIRSRTHGEVAVPCMTTMLVRPALIQANTWNPNTVSGDRMELLRQSILDNGFAFPIVVIWDNEIERFVIIDGFHRTLIGGAEWLDFDYLPVAVLNHGIAKRMAATIQFNKARGIHQIDLDADVVRALLEQGLSEEDVSQHLGMDLDTVHRYKQLTGIAELFKKADYSVAWEMVES